MILALLFGFVVTMAFAIVQYPGGNDWDAAHGGFDLLRNYWCDLARASALNGAQNVGRPAAGVAALCLVGALGLFWWTVPRRVGATNGRISSLGVAGAIGLVGIFLTPGMGWLHWGLIVVGVGASLSAVVALNRVAWAQHRLMSRWGLLMIALVALNFGHFALTVGGVVGWSPALPAVQKVATLAFVVWLALGALAARTRTA